MGKSSLSWTGLDRPLPPQLERRLLAIPARGEASFGTPLPDLPLPERLHRRLIAIGARSPQGDVSEAIRTPRLALVASYLLAMLTLLTVGDPVIWAQGVARDVQGEVTEVSARLESNAQEIWREVRGEAHIRVGAARDAVDDSIDWLLASALEVVAGTGPTSSSIPEPIRKENRKKEIQDD